jgi:hypothetical protein
MTRLSAERRTFYEEQKAIKIVQLAAANETLTDILGTPGQDYWLDTGEAEQRTRLKKMEDAYEIIDRLTAEIDRLCRLLAGGGGVIHLNLRRRI